MPWKMYLDPDVNCAFIKNTGAFEFGSLGSAIDSITAQPEFQSGMNILRDLRDQPIPSDVTFKSLAEDRKLRVEANNQIFGKCKLAVVTGDSQTYAKVHQFIVAGRLAERSIERKPFRDIQEAMKWLGIPEDYKISHKE